MTIYVGIVTYNSVSDLPGCFEGLEMQDQSDLEIRVWDNVSEDGTQGWLREHAPDVPVSGSAENLGFGRGHNRIIREIHLNPGDYYLTLNPDVRLKASYISTLARAIQEQKAGWGTGKLLQMDADGHPTGRIYSVGHAILRDGYFFNIGYGMVDEGQFEQGREVFGAPGAAALYSADLINDISEDGEFFDEQMFMYGEDTDVDWRARNHGWRCWYEPNAVAYHRGSDPGEELKVEAISSRYLSVIKNAPTRRLITYNLLVMFAHAGLRFTVSPRAGLQIMKNIMRGFRAAVAKRKRSQPRGADVETWFDWSRSQPTLQPKSIGERLGAVCGLAMVVTSR